MTEPIKVKIRGESTPAPGTASVSDNPRPKPIQEGANTISSGLNNFLKRPYRHPALHWAAFALSVVSLAPPIYWLANSRVPVPGNWVWFDILLSVFFILEFFTRSGFRWNPGGYVRTRFFDFIAMVPALVLVYFGAVWVVVWVWLILALRFVRMIDRLLGDDFFTRNALALAEGFEEEITDRVMLRIIARVQGDLDRGKFGEGLAKAFEHNRQSVLDRVRTQQLREGIGAGLAHLVGLDAVLERVEAKTYDAVIEVLKSPEIDTAIRESVDSTFSVMRQQIGVKSWRQHLGIRLRRP